MAFDWNSSVIALLVIGSTRFGITLFGQKGTDLTKDFILSIDEGGVARIREHHHSSARNLSAEMFDFLLVIFPLRFEKLLRVSSLRLGQRFSPVSGFLVTDGKKRKRWRFNFAVLGPGRISGFQHRVYCWTPLLPE
ncbi:MAG: hypothetical protein HYY23_01335 [Verrucomicrobia bacterium]|nr:hypothetical protein [Verrucomicrobiota bacterium]